MAIPVPIVEKVNARLDESRFENTNVQDLIDSLQELMKQGDYISLNHLKFILGTLEAVQLQRAYGRTETIKDRLQRKGLTVTGLAPMLTGFVVPVAKASPWSMFSKSSPTPDQMLLFMHQSLIKLMPVWEQSYGVAADGYIEGTGFDGFADSYLEQSKAKTAEAAVVDFTRDISLQGKRAVSAEDAKEKVNEIVAPAKLSEQFSATEVAVRDFIMQAGSQDMYSFIYDQLYQDLQVTAADGTPMHVDAGAMHVIAGWERDEDGRILFNFDIRQDSVVDFNTGTQYRLDLNTKGLTPIDAVEELEDFMKASKAKEIAPVLSVQGTIEVSANEQGSVSLHLTDLSYQSYSHQIDSNIPTPNLENKPG